MNGFKEIYNDTWVMEDGGVRIFLAAGKEKALVIDTGMTGLDIHKSLEVSDAHISKTQERQGYVFLLERITEGTDMQVKR